MTRILLLLPTRTYRTGDFLAAAHRLGLEVVVGAERRNVLESLAGAGTIRVQLDDPERGAATIERYARERRLDAVIGVDDGSTLVAAAAAERLSLQHNSLAAVERSRDKAQARTAFAAAGLPNPRFARYAATSGPAGSQYRVFVWFLAFARWSASQRARRSAKMRRSSSVPVSVAGCAARHSAVSSPSTAAFSTDAR